jgi:GNAT superfamily N-acetyltransferase
VATFRIRPAQPEDAEELALTVVEGFDSYRAFAPRFWEPPGDPSDVLTLRRRLADERVWCQVGEREQTMAGHCAFLPSEMGHWPGPGPELAHLWQLFVRQPFWGAGLATDLLGAAVREAGRRGFEAIRLFTPAGHGRARRFYEREGWTPAGPPVDGAGFGMPLVEYRRNLHRGETG